MGGMEVLFVEILIGDYVQQQFGYEVWVVMLELVLYVNGFNLFSKMKCQCVGVMLVQCMCFFGKLGCVGGDQLVGLVYVWLVEVFQEVGGELEQVGMQVVIVECMNYGFGGVVDVVLYYLVQQLLFVVIV